MADQNMMKKNPAFIAFWGSNVSTSNENTQVQDAEKAKSEVKQDQKYAGGNTDNGGEQGKA